MIRIETLCTAQVRRLDSHQLQEHIVPTQDRVHHSVNPLKPMSHMSIQGRKTTCRTVRLSRNTKHKTQRDTGQTAWKTSGTVLDDHLDI
jgi:hypothetical protein